MTKTIVSLLLFFFLINIAISDIDKTKLFSKYLSNFNLEIAKERNCYIILIAEGCDRCVDFNIEFTKSIKNKKNITLIISYKYKLINNEMKKLSKLFKTIFDKKGLFTKYNISPYNACLIITKNRKIVEIIKFDKMNREKQKYIKKKLKK